MTDDLRCGWCCGYIQNEMRVAAIVVNRVHPRFPEPRWHVA